jgi:peroxiredoxin
MKLNGKMLAAFVVAGGLAVGTAWAQNKPTETKPTEKPQEVKPGEAQPDVKPDKKPASNTDGRREAKWGTAKVGETAPTFTLPDTEGKTTKLEDFKGKIVVLQWFNPKCPFVQKHYGKDGSTFNDMYKDFHDKGVVFLGVNSSAFGKEGHGKDVNSKARTDWAIEYPILLDETGKVGHEYNAKNTPLMLVIGKDGKIVYRGAIDNQKDFKSKDYKNYVRQALEQTIKGETVTEPETQPYGCNVKY